jgi:hypothetical protein
MPYIIIKHIERKGTHYPVIMLDDHEEVWEFDSHDEAQHMASILETNSDSGWKYEVKKV